MRNLPAVLFLAFAACGGGGEETPQPVDSQPPDTTLLDPDGPLPPDSQVLDMSCAANQTAPTTATPTVTASGAANQLDIQGISPDLQPLPQADINVCVGDCQGNSNLDSTTSAMAPCGQAGCDFTTAAIDTPNDEPLDAYLKVGKTGLVTSNIFPSEPIRADLANVPALAMTTNAFSTLGALAGGQTPGNGALIVIVTDCGLQPVAGATLTVTQGGTPVGNTPVDVGQFVTELSGTFLVFNVPPGATTVDATANGSDFRAHDVEVFADQVSATQVTPGFAAP